MEQVEPGTFKYENRPVFVRWPKETGDWHVWGPETTVKQGHVSQVYRYASDDTTAVEILDYVAERMVLRQSGDRIRFVVATFDKVMEE